MGQLVNIIETQSNIIIKDWDYLDIDFKISYSKFFGYCQWARPPKSTKLKLFVGEMWRYAPNSFVYFFWETLHHEILHAIGHRIKFKNYSSKSDDHFVWIQERIMDYLIEIWVEKNELENIKSVWIW